MRRYTLYYFNGRGRAEICRMLFAAAGVQYTDRRIEFQEWDRYKDEMPSNCVPVLEIDNKIKVPQTMAISRFLAREFDFYGRAHMDMFHNDYICDCLYEVMDAYMKYFHARHGRFTSEPNPDMSSGTITQSEKAMTIGHANIELHRYRMALLRALPFLENILSRSKKPFFLGDQMMLCDMMCYSFLERPYLEDKTVFKEFPLVLGLMKRVSVDELIASYLSSRGTSPW